MGPADAAVLHCRRDWCVPPWSALNPRTCCTSHVLRLLPVLAPGLAGTNVFNAALENGATVWDTLAVSNLSGIGAASSWSAAADGNGSAMPAGNASVVAPSKVALPCYLPGSPVGDYLGGDQAHKMMAWGDAQDPSGAWGLHASWLRRTGPAWDEAVPYLCHVCSCTSPSVPVRYVSAQHPCATCLLSASSAAPASVVSEVPGNTPSCSQQGALWAVDLRYTTQLALVRRLPC